MSAGVVDSADVAHRVCWWSWMAELIDSRMKNGALVADLAVKSYRSDGVK